MAQNNIGPVITISRQFGAGGYEVAEKLAKRLGKKWEICDKEVIEEIAHSAQVRTHMVETLDEHAQSLMDEMIQAVFTKYVLESMGYRRHLAIVLLTFAHQGHKIIIGRGANFILKDALNIRLEASEKFCTQMIMDRYKFTHGKALKLIHQVDRDRAAFTRTIFDRDVTDPAGYDIVLKTDRLGFDATAVIIETAWHEKKKSLAKKNRKA